jgi:hypothetical protein
MAGAGKKTFTAGETLTASDVNTYLMEQSVMNFGGTAARASAIPTPSTGMTTYIGTTGTAAIPQLESYTGAAWQNLGGLVLLATVPYSAASSVTLDNVFTTQYEDYRIMLDTTNLTSAGNITATLRTAAPADLNAASYIYLNNGFALSAGTTPSAISNANNQTSAVVGYVNNITNSVIFDLLNVPVAQQTQFVGQMMTSSPTDIFAAGMVAVYKVAVAAFGIRFNFTANTTGTVRIYGYRNS